MPDSDTFVQHCGIAMREGCFGEPGGRDRWQRPTYSLMLRRTFGDGRAQLVVITGLRFDDPVLSAERVMKQFLSPKREAVRAQPSST